eukprot:g56927.t1
MHKFYPSETGLWEKYVMVDERASPSSRADPLSKVFRLDRIVSLLSGLTLLWAPEQLGDAVLVSADAKLALRSWGCLILTMALIVHFAPGYPPEARATVGRTMFLLFATIASLYGRALYKADDIAASCRREATVAAAWFALLCLGYGVALLATPSSTFRTSKSELNLASRKNNLLTRKCGAVMFKFYIKVWMQHPKLDAKQDALNLGEDEKEATKGNQQRTEALTPSYNAEQPFNLYDLEGLNRAAWTGRAPSDATAPCACVIGQEISVLPCGPSQDAQATFLHVVLLRVPRTDEAGSVKIRKIILLRGFVTWPLGCIRVRLLVLGFSSVVVASGA